MKKLTLLAAALCCLAACNSNVPTVGAPELFAASDYDTVIDGKKVSLYTLKNAAGMTAQVTNYGAIVVDLWVPAADSTFKNVAIGYPAIADHFVPENTYVAAVIGPFANRIAKGQFTIDGKSYQLPTNNGENTLHGAFANFAKKVWDVKPVAKNSAGEEYLDLSILSPDGDYGFPGNLTVNVRYTVTNNNELKIEYTATTDAPTVINLTNHAYFNLHGGDGKTSTFSHMLQIDADTYTPTDSGLIPTGEFAPVEGTALDFRTPRAVGERMAADDPIFADRYGYDHNYVINREAPGTLVTAAEAYEPATGIVMTVVTDTPGVQFFSGRSRLRPMPELPAYRSFICLEAQNYPDAPNHENFPSAVLRPGETYTQTCIYAFSVR